MSSGAKENMVNIFNNYHIRFLIMKLMVMTKLIFLKAKIRKITTGK